VCDDSLNVAVYDKLLMTNYIIGEAADAPGSFVRKLSLLTSNNCRPQEMYLYNDFLDWVCPYVFLTLITKD
jgi:hypothetical protein